MKSKNNIPVYIALVIVGLLLTANIVDYFIELNHEVWFGHYALSPLTTQDNKTHLLGTTHLGQDVWQIILEGASVSIKVAFTSIFIALVVGAFLGLLAGYYGNKTIKLNIGATIGLVLGALLGWFYGFDARSLLLENALQSSAFLLLAQILISILILTVFLFAISYLGSWLTKQMVAKSITFYLPVDTIISRCTEVFAGVPKIIIIISLSTISKPSLTNLILIIGFTAWVPFSRYMRAEVLKLKEQEFINSLKLLGFSDLRIMVKHLIPNAITPLLVTAIFGISGAILVESSLSFLNIGVPSNVQTWGKLLAVGRLHLNLWWMVIAPGICIFLTIMSVNIIANFLKEKLLG